ncbi:type II secretion system protein GspM [Marinobacter halophilus]|uniref:Type II secretion system protein M n=1 Tax=Marinobacter halophilus TaxID=1323740 RepID=A0A2T1K7X6_9GAMM|nr:type II secretion system protein M [Marinobacter halophilus]PSF06264.1 type II secretion system protein M [Marinobacter halophilus]GGC71117.1 type II secretion system protein M [Marinobacter halophilus]
MWTRIKDQPAIGKLIAQYDQLPVRDRQALGALAVALLVAVLYFAIWRPVSDFREQAEASRENAEQLLAWMQANEASIRRLGGAGSTASAGAAVDKPADGRALMALVTRSAGEAGLSLQRFEPSGENAIRVWLEGVPFADVAAWLEQLDSRNGVIIDQAAIDRGNQPGRVSVRLTLMI